MATLGTSYLYEHNVEKVFDAFMDIVEREIGKKPYKGLKFKKKRSTTKGTVTMDFAVTEYEDNHLYGTTMHHNGATYVTRYTFDKEETGCSVTYFEEATRPGKIAKVSDSIALFFFKKKRIKRVQTLFMYVDRLISEGASLDQLAEEAVTSESEKYKEKLDMKLEYEVEDEER